MAVHGGEVALIQSRRTGDNVRNPLPRTDRAITQATTAPKRRRQISGPLCLTLTTSRVTSRAVSAFGIESCRSWTIDTHWVGDLHPDLPAGRLWETWPGDVSLGPRPGSPLGLAGSTDSKRKFGTAPAVGSRGFDFSAPFCALNPARLATALLPPAGRAYCLAKDLVARLRSPNDCASARASWTTGVVAMPSSRTQFRRLHTGPIWAWSEVEALAQRRPGCLDRVVGPATVGPQSGYRRDFGRT